MESDSEQFGLRNTTQTDGFGVCRGLSVSAGYWHSYYGAVFDSPDGSFNANGTFGAGKGRSGELPIVSVIKYAGAWHAAGGG